MNRCSLISFIAAVLIAEARVAPAHEFFVGYIQHRVAVALGAKYTDVTVQLTFFEDPAEHERERIDTNGDGHISRAEIDAYVQALEPRLACATALRIGGQPIALIPLRAPELDLLGNDTVTRGHLRLTLYYFAATPANIAPSTELVVEDRLWPDKRALGSIQVEGKDACRIEAVPAGDPVFPPAKDNEARCFKARVLSPPESLVAHSTRAQTHRSPKQPKEPLTP